MSYEMENPFGETRLNQLSERDVLLRNERMVDPKLRFTADMTDEERSEASRKHVSAGGQGNRGDGAEGFDGMAWICTALTWCLPGICLAPSWCRALLPLSVPTQVLLGPG